MSLSDGTRCGISYIGYGIFIGGQGSLDPFEIASQGITHIVSIGKDSLSGIIPPGRDGRPILYYNVDVEDEESAPWAEVFHDPSLRPNQAVFKPSR